MLLAGVREGPLALVIPVKAIRVGVGIIKQCCCRYIKNDND